MFGSRNNILSKFFIDEVSLDQNLQHQMKIYKPGSKSDSVLILSVWWCSCTEVSVIKTFFTIIVADTC
jgi:hypothetical protein